MKEPPVNECRRLKVADYPVAWQMIRLNGEPHLFDRKEKGLSPMAYEQPHSQKLPRNY